MSAARRPHLGDPSASIVDLGFLFGEVLETCSFFNLETPFQVHQEYCAKPVSENIWLVKIVTISGSQV